jgi:hypothetical protein
VEASLRKLIDGFGSLPPRTRQRLAPKGLSALDPAKPFTDKAIAALFAGSTAGGPFAAPTMPPEITKLAPAPIVPAKTPLVISGKHFSNVAAKNIVRLIEFVPPPDPDLKTTVKHLADLTPSAASTSQLTVTLPHAGMTIGRGYQVQVIRKGDDRLSNGVGFQYGESGLQITRYQLPSLTLDAKAQQPGKSILFSGKNLGKALALPKKDTLRPYTLQAVLLSTTADLPNVTCAVTIVKPSSLQEPAGQGQLLIPLKTPPGSYRVQFTANMNSVVDQFDGGSVWQSALIPFEVLPYKYRVDFTQLTCLDESNEASPSDEVMVIWSAIAGGFGAQAKPSQEMGDIDAGETHPFSAADRTVFRPDNSPGPVSDALVITTQLWEVDDIANVLAALAATEAACAAVAPLAALASPVAGLILAAGSILVGASATFAAIIGNGSEHLGVQKNEWTAVNLQLQTQNPERRFAGQLQFLNADSEGSFAMDFTVSRFD